MSPPERVPSKKIRHNWHLADAGAHETRRGNQRAHSKPVSRGTGDGRDKSPGSLRIHELAPLHEGARLDEARKPKIDHLLRG